jgi:predicted metal-dependent HD superfamily phosphohydrolase
MTRTRFYHTGRSLRARLQQWRRLRAYSRPVTFADLRKISHDAMTAAEAAGADPEAARALFDAVIEDAERPVWRAEGRANANEQ